MKKQSMPRYVVAGSRPWNRVVFEHQIANLPGEWQFAANGDELTHLLSEYPSPRYVFFLHWSVRVPDIWLENHECVCFHMTDLPYGRGGSPLQNLIAEGRRETQITALRMVREIDAGPVYLKVPMSLEGNAEEIYLRAGKLSASMIASIVNERIVPQAQNGQAVVFKRRKPEQSQIPEGLSDLGSMHDFIRMLDAEGYPRAFFECKGFRFEFNRASLLSNRLIADVSITQCSPMSSQ